MLLYSGETDNIIIEFTGQKTLRITVSKKKEYLKKEVF